MFKEMLDFLKSSKIDFKSTIGIILLIFVLTIAFDIFILNNDNSELIQKPYILIFINFFSFCLMFLLAILYKNSNASNVNNEYVYDKLQFRSFADQVGGNKDICDMIRKQIGFLKENAKEFELYIVKYGLSTLANTDYVNSLITFMNRHGNLFIFLPEDKLNCYRQNEDLSGKEMAIKKGLNSLLEAGKNFKALTLYIFDINHMIFFKHLKIGLFIKRKKYFDEDVENLGMAYINLKDHNDSRINVTNITTNENFVLFMQYLKKIAKHDCKTLTFEDF